MNQVDAQEFIQELKFCLDNADMVKAQALLQFASDDTAAPQLQHQALVELAQGPDELVFPLLKYLGHLSISAPGFQEELYALILDKAFGNTHRVKTYIQDPDKTIRLLFIRAAGDLFLQETAPELEAILSREADTDVVGAAIDALGALGLPRSLKVLAAMADRPQRDIQRRAISAIAQSGSRDAVDLLLQFTGSDDQINILAIEALADIQNFYALEQLTALLGSPRTNVRDTATDQLIKMGTKATPLLTRAFRNAQADYLVHLITTLGYIKDNAAIQPILTIINTQPADPNIRQAAYEAMEKIPSPRTAISLVQGVQDPVESVRMAAARAIDCNLTSPLMAGLKNIIREHAQGACMAVAALIDVQADQAFDSLMDEPAFVALAVDHVKTQAAPAVRAAFVKKMADKGLAHHCKDIEPDQEITRKDISIVVIDDSKMMLRLYQNKLSALGISPHLFEDPEKALPFIINRSPHLVITDLNMPHISGLELTREIRHHFSRDDLPVIMVTTQNDFITKAGQNKAQASRLNKILNKPFTDAELFAAIQEFIPARD